MSFASLSLQVSLICPKPDAKVPEDHKPTAEELAKDFRFDPAYDLDKEPDAEVTQILYSSLSCPKKELIEVYFKESLPNFAQLIGATDCSSLAKTDIYRAYAQKGKDLAKEYYDTFTCSGGCDKVPFDKVSYQEWGCDPADKAVVVKTFFYVECKPKH